MRVLGLDIGDVRIGVAVSDPTGLLATPIKVVSARRKAQAIAEITSLCEEHEVEKIVVGMPLSLSGLKGHQAHKVEEFCRQLERKTSVPLVFWDERFTTVYAEKIMNRREGRKSLRREDNDAIAAAIILQDYLDSGRLPSARDAAFNPLP